MFSGPTTYTAVDPSQLTFVGQGQVEFVPNPGLANFTGTPVLVLFFSPLLTNAGGTSSLPGAYETTCFDSSCSGPGPTRRTFTAGAVSTIVAGVPALSQVGMGVLFVLLIGSSAFLLRRRTVSRLARMAGLLQSTAATDSWASYSTRCWLQAAAALSVEWVRLTSARAHSQ